MIMFNEKRLVKYTLLVLITSVLIGASPVISQLTYTGNYYSPDFFPPSWYTYICFYEPLFENPYKNYLYWYKGNTHTHTNKSDGKLSLNEVATLYKTSGYNFLAITDHNKVGTQYSSDILILQGCESGDWWENHLIAIGANTCPEECGSCVWSGSGLPYCNNGENQKRINQVLSKGGLAILAHPSVRGKYCFPGDRVEMGWSLDKMKNVTGYHAIEIISGGATSLSEWKSLLDLGRRVWGVASDDFHDKPNGRGWIVVNSNRIQINRADIIENIKMGNFYAVKHIGGYKWPMIKNITVCGGTITVSGGRGKIIRFIGENNKLYGAYFWLKDTDELSISYTSSGKERYIRVEIEDSFGNMAYSQPLFKKYASSTDASSLDFNCSNNPCSTSYHCCGGSCYPNSMMCP